MVATKCNEKFSCFSPTSSYSIQPLKVNNKSRRKWDYILTYSFNATIPKKGKTIRYIFYTSFYILWPGKPVSLENGNCDDDDDDMVAGENNVKPLLFLASFFLSIIICVCACTREEEIERDFFYFHTKHYRHILSLLFLISFLSEILVTLSIFS